MRILVTGGAGFIGSHLVDRLLQEGHEVDVIDNFDPFYAREFKEKNLERARTSERFKLFEIDIRDKSRLDDYFNKRDIDQVVHLAAKAGVRPSIEDPVAYYETNVMGTLNILENLKRKEIKKLVFASSSSVYGNNKKVPFSEDDPVDNPISPYAATKKACELLCYNYFHLYGINTFALRFFTVYGPRQRPEMAIHKFVRMVQNNEELPIYGEGKPERDYTYIDDIISGVLGAIEHVNGFEIINLGESRTIGLLQLVEEIEKNLNKTGDKKLLPMQAGDVITTYADISKAKDLLGYNPSVGVEEGVGGFVEWYKTESEK